MRTFTERQMRLLEWVKDMHGDQRRKYTGEPYWFHLVAVAELMMDNYHSTAAVEIAMCHDLFEDTECDWETLSAKLGELGYPPAFTHRICEVVQELTDEYTKEKYPDKNRDWRKFMEVQRMRDVSDLAKTIKCADLIDNTRSIVEHDPGFAETYIKEKRMLLIAIKDEAHASLLFKAIHLLIEAEKQLEQI